MKANKFLPMLLGIFLYVGLAILLTGYGNKKTHPDINTTIVDTFDALNNKGNASMPKFKDYLFQLDYKAFTGDAVTKEGLFHPEQVDVGNAFNFMLNTYYEEGSKIFTAKEWISHGGMSADVPEVPASLRHFYDPTKSAGDRFLKDKANSKIMGFAQRLFSNPMIDGVEWAVGQPNAPIGVQEHYYTWENGKKWMKAALEESDMKKRDELMAKVWRSLGETLHMIADHGCPSHVRNDAHPSPLMNNNTIFGNPDPYEEFVDEIRNYDVKLFLSLFEGKPNGALKTELEQSKTVRDIAHALALYTNTNFVTTETISGINRYDNYKKQIIRPDDPYSKPLLDQMKYEGDYYTMMVGDVSVKQCTDISYFARIIPQLSYPYVDMESVKTQAKALMPNIVEAGVQTVKLYIPQLAVEVQKANSGKISGIIKHTTDDEYKNEIKYNGSVFIKIKDSSKKDKSEHFAIATNGKFEVTDLSFNESDLIIAEIEFGGVTVKSKEFVSGAASYDYPIILITAKVTATYDLLNNGNINSETFELTASSFLDKESPISWNGNNFSVSRTVKDTGNNGKDTYDTKIEFSGTINQGSPKTVSGSVNVTYNTITKDTQSGINYAQTKKGSYSYQFNNVPSTLSYDVPTGISFNSLLTNTDLQNYLSGVTYKEEISIVYESVWEPIYKNRNFISIDWKEGGKIYVEMRYK